MNLDIGLRHLEKKTLVETSDISLNIMQTYHALAAISYKDVHSSDCGICTSRYFVVFSDLSHHQMKMTELYC